MSSPILFSLLPLTIPLLLLAGAATSRRQDRWRAARWASGSALLVALLASAAALANLSSDAGLGGLVSQAPASLVMATLITFMTWVLVRYSRNYLRGEPSEVRYLAMLQLTPAAVTVAVLSDHLLLLLTGVLVISLALHQLLLFYPDRPRAALAAHKKFLFARLAELCLLAAALLLHSHHGTWHISAIVASYPVTALSAAEQAAALLLAAAALIKCAQLPMHGWLIQVVEAPTPVSALLHGGIINLGGYLLILFGPLLVQATAAQWLLLVVGGATAVLAALVMATRISVKVKLAWSTSAQMGLMLVQCALGLFHLALLHLVAHACYKAWCFLDAGSAVEKDAARRLAPARTPTAACWFGAASLSLPVAVGVPLLLGLTGPLAPWLLIGLALSLVIAERSSLGYRAAVLPAATVALLVAGAYAAQTWMAQLFTPALPASAGMLADMWVCALILVLAFGNALLRYRPRAALSGRLAVWLYAGFYLDEWTTRTTLRIWPARLPMPANSKRLLSLTEEVS